MNEKHIVKFEVNPDMSIHRIFRALKPFCSDKQFPNPEIDTRIPKDVLRITFSDGRIEDLKIK